MAETLTALLELVKPEINQSGNVWGQRLNEDLDKLDAKILDLSGAAKTNGTATAYTLTATGPNFLKAGSALRMQLHVANGAAATLSVNGLAPKPLYYYDLTGTAVAVPAGLMRLNSYYDIVYNPSIASGIYVVTSSFPVASQVANTPAGILAATNVQAALDELATEKVQKTGDTMTGALTVSLAGGSTGIVVNTTGTTSSIASQLAGVTAAYLQSATGKAVFGHGQSGSTMELSGGLASLNTNALRIVGAIPQVLFLETDYDSVNPSQLYVQAGTLNYNASGSGNNYWQVGRFGEQSCRSIGANNPVGVAVTAVSSTANAISASSGGGHGVTANTSNGSFAGVVGTSHTGQVGFLGLGAFGVYSAGNTYSGSGYQSSDERLKENVQTVDIFGILDIVQRLTVRSFDWKEGSDARRNGRVHDVGLLAQEVLGVLPDIVATIPAAPVIEGVEPSLNQQLGETYGIDAGRLIFYLLAAVQKLASIVDPLATRTSKYRMFERMSDEEVAGFVYLMSQQSQRRQLMFDHCTYLDHADPFFAELRWVMQTQWGAERAAFILASDDPV